MAATTSNNSNKKEQLNNEMSELDDNNTLSLNTDTICLVKNRTVKRTTPEEQHKNVIVCNDIDQAVKYLEQGGTYHEIFLNDCWTRFYFDIERDDYETEPTDEVKEDIKQACVDDIRYMFRGECDFNDNQIAIAQRHRWIEKKGIKTFKVSFRFYIKGFKIRYTHIPYYVKEYGYAEPENKVKIINVCFDMAVYNKNNQLLGAIHNCKESKDMTNPLVICSAHTTKDFVAQYFEGGEQVIDMSHKIPPPPPVIVRDMEFEKTPDEQEIVALLNLLKQERVDDRKMWRNMAWCLKTVGENMFPIFIEWSKKSDKFDINECEKIWEQGKIGEITIGTLKHFAKLDDPEGYANIYKDNITRLIISAQSQTHYDIARAVKCMYNGEFACASIKNGTWYWFNDHRWNEDEHGTTLSTRLSTDVYCRFMEVAACFTAKASMEKDETEQARYASIAKRLMAVASKLKFVSFKNNILTELSHMFFIVKFMEKLDEKHHLLGFNNGVYDLDEMLFREGKPDDYISLSTGYDYTDEIDEAYRDHILTFYDSIQDTKEMTDYTLLTLATSLHGTKRNQMVIFWIGIGANGKGTAVCLCQGALGGYMYCPAIELYTTKRKSSSQANPELAKAKGVRLMVSTEPEEDEVIYVGLIKAVTGGDKQQARALYVNPFEFIVQALPIIQMNKKPALSGTDGGIKRRLRNITFPYRFCDEPTKSKDKQMDKELGNAFKNDVKYHQQFMLILLERYRAYKESGWVINTPERVAKETQDYLNENNHVANFIVENYDEDEKSMVNATTAFTAFKETDEGKKMKMRATSFYEAVVALGYEVYQNKERGLFRDKKVIAGLKYKYDLNDDYN